MSTLNDQWRDYRNKVYPTGIPAEQNRECHQAFMAGALVALMACRKISELPDEREDQALAELEKLYQEAEEFCRLRCIALKEGRN